jgi:hypothetical protein
MARHWDCGPDALRLVKGSPAANLLQSPVSASPADPADEVRFKAVAGMTNLFGESPEDVIESVSKPYLEFGHSD